MRIRNYTIFTSLASAFLFAFSITAMAQAPGAHRQQIGGSGGSNSIQGKVMLPDGKPAARIRVVITSPDIPGETTYTDQDGEFRFGSLLKGNFTLTAYADGFPATTEYTQIERGGPSGQQKQVIIYIRGEGQPKGAPTNPMLVDVPKDALKKFQKASEIADKDPKATLAALDEAIALHPKFALAYYEKGKIYQSQNDFDNALAAFVKAIEIKPDYLEAKIQFGVVSNSVKEYERAAQVFLDVIKQKNDIPQVYFQLGVSFINLKQYDNAEKAFKQTVTLKGGENIAIAHRYLGGLYMQKNLNGEAIAELQKYLDLAPKAPDADKIKATIEDLKKKKG